MGTTSQTFSQERSSIVAAEAAGDAERVARYLDSPELSGNGSYSTRGYAAYVLGRMEASDHESAIRRMLEVRPPPDASMALYGLSRIATADSFDLFAAAAASDDAEFRVMAAAGLGQIGGDAAVQLLRLALSDPDRDVQQQVATELAGNGDVASLAAVEALRDATPRWQIRRRYVLTQAVTTLAQRASSQ